MYFRLGAAGANQQPSGNTSFHTGQPRSLGCESATQLTLPAGWVGG